MSTVYDLSHPIVDGLSCTFGLSDTRPQVSFEEGDSHGTHFITSRLDNIHSNICTHIDFPGHMAAYARNFLPTVGEYPVETFLGHVLVVDCSAKVSGLDAFFDERGILTVNLRSDPEVEAFVEALEALAVTAEDIQASAKRARADLLHMRGVLLHSGLWRFWAYERFPSWQYRYFITPFFSEDALALVREAGVSFVGIDAFQIEHPIVNFRGDELPFVTNPRSRHLVVDKIQSLSGTTNHDRLLGADILIYENLMLPEAIADTVIQFAGVPLNLRLSGLNDNALVRPYGWIYSSPLKLSDFEF